MDDEILSNESVSFLKESDILGYNKTEYVLPAQTILTVAICTAGILANSLIVMVVLLGSLRNLVIMNLLLALAIIENLIVYTIISKCI